MGRLVLVFDDFEQVHLGKDVFLVPYCLGRQLRKQAVIVYPATPTNASLPREHRGVRLVRLYAGREKRYFVSRSVAWICCHRADLDVLMLFHFKRLSMVLANIVSLLRPTAKIYAKADSEFCFSDFVSEYKYPFLKRWLYKRYLRVLDCVSFETSRGFQKSQTDTFYGVGIKGKSVLMPNGFDEDLMESYGIRRIPQEQKEKLVITVGRIGDALKNTEMLLRAVPQVRLNGWKVLLIGPVRPGFEETIRQFYEANPDYRESVEFVGNVPDKEKLWGYYNRASAFVLTSRREGFALVLVEARRFGCYIISTELPCAADCLHGKADGKIIAADDDKGLAAALQELADGKIDITKVTVSDCSWANKIETVSRFLG